MIVVVSEEFARSVIVSWMLWVKSETIVFLFFWVQNSFRENRLDFILIFLRIYFEKNTIYANLYSIWNDLILFLDLLNRARRALWKEMGNIIEKYLSEHFEISSELKSKEIWINCEAFSSISYPEIIRKFLF